MFESLLNDLPQYERKIRENWDYFTATRNIPHHQRSTITASWKRCLQHGLDPFSSLTAPLLYENQSLKDLQEENLFLIDIVSPMISSIIDSRTSEELVLALVNNEGNLLHIAASSTINQHIRNRFPLGTNWKEDHVGTNALGTALFEKKPLQIFAEEHYCQSWHSLFSSAAPIRDPFTREVIGVLTLSKDKNIIGAQDLFTAVNHGHKIERKMSETLIKHNNFALRSLFNNSKAPFTVFNNDGQITFFNQAAQHAFSIQLGDSISTFIQGYPFLDQTDYLYRNEHGSEWKTRVQPYKIGANLYGGIAVFEQLNVKKYGSKRNKIMTRYQFSSIITENPDMQKILSLAKKAALHEKTVLLTGETGTGKEMIAQSIHAHGPRQGDFIEINCGAITGDLAASELFGYEAGAFTGANPKGKPGKFTLAHQGTIFLDEIGDLSLEAQAFLLRILEERTVIAIGGSKPIAIDVQVIAATHKDLQQEVSAGNFREDLYYRLNVIQIKIPPLRQRREDIPILIRHFSHTQPKNAISQDVYELFASYPWPGNIRQLKNTLEHAFFYAEGKEITVDDLPQELLSQDVTTTEDFFIRDKWKKNQFSDQELILSLQKNDGNISKTAQMLNVSRVTIYRKLKELEKSGTKLIRS